MARTGSGKTAAFLIPLLERLKGRGAKVSGLGSDMRAENTSAQVGSHSRLPQLLSQGGMRALVLSPTRELALQTYKFSINIDAYYIIYYRTNYPPCTCIQRLIWGSILIFLVLSSMISKEIYLDRFKTWVTEQIASAQDRFNDLNDKKNRITAIVESSQTVGFV